MYSSIPLVRCRAAGGLLLTEQYPAVARGAAPCSNTQHILCYNKNSNQAADDDVTAETIRNTKVVFTPGSQIKEMPDAAKFQKE